MIRTPKCLFPNMCDAGLSSVDPLVLVDSQYGGVDYSDIGTDAISAFDIQTLRNQMFLSSLFFTTISPERDSLSWSPNPALS